MDRGPMTITELEIALRALIAVFTEGRNYETQNPYTRPEIKAALEALRENPFKVS